MNKAQLFSLLRSGFKLGGAWLVSHNYLGSNTANWAVGGALMTLGFVWSHLLHAPVPPDDNSPALPGFKCLGVTGALLLGACAVAPTLVGCTSITAHGYQMQVTTRGVGIDIETVDNANASPRLRLGFFSSTVIFNPTSTNGPINAARSMNSIDTRATANPLDTSIREQIGTGDVYLGGTNDVDKAIVPSAFTPLNLSTNR